MRGFTPVNITQSVDTVKSLPQSVIQKIAEKYPRGTGAESMERLAQGEFDILDSCRQALGWRTVTSLAYKYYPLYPSRQCWKRALAICMRYKDKWRTRSLNIKYLLMAVIQQVAESLAGQYDKVSNAIRIVSLNTLKGSSKDYSNSKGVWGKRPKAPRIDPDKYIRGPRGHMVIR